ncbi:hypothetical protein NLI96_g13054 [Meripilus lineatus]|uniref:PEBP-like protein n=1 Tax=Meripilus lineatus TaxID=2056292 RepID=A0AAD5USN5_9APHY|nr:hypothetical protein NLI96_g13054 [Physisporinus lineatus]
MVFLPLVLSLAAAPFVLAQSNNTQLQIEGIEAHFNNSGLVPSLLTTFEPTAVFTLSFADVKDVNPGQLLTRQQVAPTPQLLVTPANSSVSLTGEFTLAMVDAGPVGTDESAGQTRHWLVNGVTLSGSPLNVSTTGGLAVTQYAGPAPPQGSGAHRQVHPIWIHPFCQLTIYSPAMLSSFTPNLLPSPPLTVLTPPTLASRSLTSPSM